MTNLAIFIPAQEENRHNKLGDLAPFGDTTLLQWKISQCKDLVDSSHIYISTNSKKIEEIALNDGVNCFKRPSNETSINDQLKLFANNIDNNNILWTNVTSPFLGSDSYISMFEKYNKIPGCNLIISTVQKEEYAFFNNQKLNFDTLVSRSKIQAITLCTNGAYLFKTNFLRKENDIFDTDNICFYNLDSLSSVEIKDVASYSIAQNLLAFYFSNMLKKTNV